MTPPLTTPAADVRQITVVRAGALGDTLLALPTLALLREVAPHAHLTFIARADTLALARANGLADDAWPWDLPDWGVLFAPPGARLALTACARAALTDADAVILWTPDPDSALTARLAELGARRSVIAPATPPADLTDAPHTAVWLAQALLAFGATPPANPAALATHLAPLRTTAHAEAEADALWLRLRLAQRVVALHPGSGSAAKRWPAERFAAVARLASAAGYQPLLLAGEADAEALAETQAALRRQGETAAAVAQGQPIATVAALLARCAGYVGCDSGVAHLAGLVGTPTVAVFGPTDPAHWAPLGPRVRPLRAPSTRLDELAAGIVWDTLLALSDGATSG